jgi:hypothetical protein
MIDGARSVNENLIFLSGFLRAWRIVAGQRLLDKEISRTEGFTSAQVETVGQFQGGIDTLRQPHGLRDSCRTLVSLILELCLWLSQVGIFEPASIARKGNMDQSLIQ